MKKFLKAQLAANILLVLLGLLFVFHVLLLAGVIPYDFVWGGNLTSQEQMIRMEVTALAATLLIMVVVALKIGYLQAGRFQRVVDSLMWLVFIYFILNTVGNVLSNAQNEMRIFTPITIIMAICAYRLAIEKGEQSSVNN